ncbi:hypothetical protein ACQUW6_22125 [Bacillus thuringiensis]|uniref:hypothetical protein n=1 Tax=Bacillus thuringiensis TaxID=1428 RepID=UPI003D0D876D
MKLGSKIAAGIFTLSLTIGTFAPSSFASTTEVKKDSEKIELVQKEGQIQSIKENYSDPKVQKNLIEKVNVGEKLDNINPEKKALGKKEIINESTTLTTYPDGSKEETGIDYSQAKFFDEKGNEVHPIKTEQLKGITGPQGSITGGSWQRGSGYACVQGAKVYRNAYSAFTVYYYADYCHHQGAYDKLDRVYGWDIKAPGGGYSKEDWGVFRQWQKPGYEAYGGISFKYTDSRGGDTHQWLYIRVAGGSAWEDSNI